MDPRQPVQRFSRLTGMSPRHDSWNRPIIEISNASVQTDKLVPLGESSGLFQQQHDQEDGKAGGAGGILISVEHKVAYLMYSRKYMEALKQLEL